MYNVQGQDAYWESGAWKAARNRYIPGAAWGTVGGVAGGIGGVLAAGWAAAKIGGTIGTILGGPVGTILGGVAGGIIGSIGGMVVGAGYNWAARQWDYIFGAGPSSKFEYKVPFVNTKLAATMRQSAMQSLMMSGQSVRQILGREASRLHR